MLLSALASHPFHPSAATGDMKASAELWAAEVQGGWFFLLLNATSPKLRGWLKVNEYKSKTEKNAREGKPCLDTDFSELSEGRGKDREGKSNMQNIVTVLWQMGSVGAGVRKNSFKLMKHKAPPVAFLSVRLSFPLLMSFHL